MSRQGLYKALAPDGNPSFETVVKVTQALGFDFRIEPHAA
jgi:probable addiction module antidote protein